MNHFRRMIFRWIREGLLTARERDQSGEDTSHRFAGVLLGALARGRTL